MLRSYQIFIDGKNVGALGRNDALEVKAPAGSLTIEARLDWGRSEPLTITAAPNRKIEIEVTNNWGALLSIWAVTFGKNTYLKLRQI
jgi:hypothetical protein